MSLHRLGLALNDAVTRQAVRDVCAASGRSELVVSSITGAGLLARAHNAELTHIVIGASVADAPATLATLEANGSVEVFVVATDPVETVQRLGLPPHRTIEVTTDEPQAIAKQIGAGRHAAARRALTTLLSRLHRILNPPVPEDP